MNHDGDGLTRDSMVSGRYLNAKIRKGACWTVCVCVLLSKSESRCDGIPSFNGREGDNDDAFAAFAFQFDPFPAHFGNQLPALAAGFIAVTAVRF